MKKYEKIDMENNMNEKAKELIDSYVWEIEQNVQLGEENRPGSEQTTLRFF